MDTVGVGSAAPDFTAPTSSGQDFTLSSLRGRIVVLYFYPKAFTPLCAAETRRFRDNYDELRALGAEVVGVSTDGVEVQCRFAERIHVPFPLVADRDHLVSKRYGVLRRIIAIDRRVTFVLDEDGVVRGVFEHEFQVLKHLDGVLNLLKQYQTSREWPAPAR
jgi:peroxiredoxin Q/BCP